MLLISGITTVSGAMRPAHEQGVFCYVSPLFCFVFFFFIHAVLHYLLEAVELIMPIVGLY